MDQGSILAEKVSACLMIARAIKFGLATTSQEDGCAFCHKPFGCREPNPGTAAGDDGHLIFESSTHEGSPYLRLTARPATRRGSSSAKKNVATMSTKLQASEAVSAFR